MLTLTIIFQIIMPSLLLDGIGIFTLNFTMDLMVNEIFYSILGESSFSGKPCVFVRLTGCNLRCRWCDTEYAFYEGKSYSIDKVISQVDQYSCSLIEITGGEPLMQDGCIILMEKLIDSGRSVLLETGGSLSISNVPDAVKKIIDFKCPSSKMEKGNSWQIMDDIQPHDEIKFVIADRTDYEWTKEKMTKHNMANKWVINMAPVFGELSYSSLAGWILEDKLDVRFQLQLHKHIWSPDRRGV